MMMIWTLYVHVQQRRWENIQTKVHKTPFTVFFLFPITILLINGRDMDLYLQAQQMSE